MKLGQSPNPLIRRIGQAGLLLAMLLVVAACAPEPEPRLRLATNQWLGYEPLYFARDRGYFAPTPIQFIELPNASAVITAFRNRAIDIAALTLDEALLLQYNGVDVRILLVLDISQGADALVAKPHIRSLAELKGKRVGMESGALGAYMLGRSLEKAGLRPVDVSIVPLTAEKHVKAYLQDNVDAMVTFEPMRSQLLKTGGRVIFDSSDIPGEIVDVLVVDGRLLQKRPDELQNVINAWFRAVQYMTANREETVQRLADQLQVGKAEAEAGISQLRWADKAMNRDLLTGAEPALLPVAGRMSEAMLQNRLISRSVNAARLFNPAQAELME